MSKKLFIILLSSVFTIGVLATLLTAIYFNPFNEVKRGFARSSDVNSFTIIVTQTSDDVLLNKKVSSYEVCGENYFVTEKLTTLSSDVFSSDNYIIEEKSFTVENDFSPSLFFTLKKKYFEETRYEESFYGFTVFTAKVKENFSDDFLGFKVSDGEISDVNVSIALDQKTISFLEASFYFNGDKFTILVDFYYD